MSSILISEFLSALQQSRKAKPFWLLCFISSFIQFIQTVNKKLILLYRLALSIN